MVQREDVCQINTKGLYMARGIDRPAQLVLVRHGESIRNERRKGAVYFADEEARATLRGIPDHKISLTEEGLEQALKTGIGLRKNYGIPDYIYHSGYLRTEQTMEQILRAYTVAEGKRIMSRVNPFIRERHAGYAYDMTKDEAEAAFPYLPEYWKTHGGFISEPPGGESLASVAERVYTFLNMLFRDRQGKNIFVVTHGGTLRCFRYLLERWSYDQAVAWPPGQSPANCGVTVYEYSRRLKRLELKEYNKIFW